MKKIIIALSIFILILITINLLLSILFGKNIMSIFSKPKNVCGSWAPLVGETITCQCKGTIVQRGGPTGPSDDRGGYLECVGIITGYK